MEKQINQLLFARLEYERFSLAHFFSARCKLRMIDPDLSDDKSALCLSARCVEFILLNEIEELREAYVSGIPLTM